jgi:TPR repeat protein
MARLFLSITLLLLHMAIPANAQFSGGGGGSTATAPTSNAAVTSEAAVNAGNAAYARRDFATAAAQYASACDAGNASACGTLGGMYLTGEGVNASGARAAAPLAKACDAGIAASCGKLGVLYDSGNGIAQNKARAFTLFSGACSRSDMVSCYNLGRLYESGQGVTLNFAEAAALYQAACTSGIADGCSSVGTMYENGVHFAKSESQAEAFYKLACNKGRARGCEQVVLLVAERKSRTDLAARVAAEKIESSKISSRRISSSVQGRPSCLKDTSYSTGGEEYWDDNIVWGEWRKRPIRTQSKVTNNCSQTIIEVHVKFFRESRSRGDNYSYTQEIDPGFSKSENLDAEYYLADQWKKIRPIFESREIKKLGRR